MPKPPDMHDPSSETLRIEVISAGAGSGKTYTLTGRMVELLRGGVRPAGIMATTFTKKAAAELQERVRVRLLEAGMTEAANELGEALIGTVHSIGTRLLQRFAFEAGVSPLVEIIADGDGQRLFNESLSQVLSEARIERMNQLADRLGLTKKTTGEAYDWRRVIRDLTDVARANNFSKTVLQTSKEHSWQSFERLLPPAQTTDAITWNNRLLSAIDQTVAAIDANEADGTKATRDAAEVLRNFQNQLKYRGELYWHEWVKIAKTNPGAKSRELMEDLHALALSHDEHVQFRDDVKAFIDLVFDIATDALSEYETYKKKRGLIDYTDMEVYVSQLLRIESVRDTLRAELDLLLVDEFQDTSPIQLDIFLQISRLARHSIWVGDPKQSIYGFRGAEPALMKAIIGATGGIRDENILKKSWRSRPDIVYATNAIFTKAFSDMPAEQVVLEPAWTAETADTPPALFHWHFRSELDERKVPGAPWFDNCVANQIQVVLDRGIPVFNKKRSETRPVRPGDIAVLCRSNKNCLDMAAALQRAGLKASISQAGLLETREAKLALACLKYLLTPSDALSAAEIILLTGNMDLEQLVEDRLEWLAWKNGVLAELPGKSWSELPFLRELNAIRPRTADFSASEILNLVLDELDLRRVAVQLGDATRRLDNLDRLRGYALDYESACQRLHSAASLGGFLLWINDLARNELDYQGSGESDDAVKVLTYHRSKGLEYPVTICHNLGQALKEQIWGLNLVSETAEPDLDNILGQRWLRFWVNPYGDQFRNTRLEETLLTTPEWAQASRTALEEEARLLYVGLTRARDYLVFPTTAHPTKWLNRVFNNGDESIPTLDPDSDETPFYHAGAALKCQVEVVYQPRDLAERLPDESPVSFHAERSGKHPAPRQSLFIDPVQEMPPGFDPQFAEPLAWSSWLEFAGDYQPAMGKALQACFLADRPGMSPDERIEIAKTQIAVRGLAESISPEALVRQTDAFRAFLEKRFPASGILGKYPLECLHGQRILKMDLDFFLDNEEQTAALMLAPFAEGMKKWRQQALVPAQMLGWARVFFKQLPPDARRNNLQMWLVFAAEGQAVELRF